MDPFFLGFFAACGLVVVDLATRVWRVNLRQRRAIARRNAFAPFPPYVPLPSQPPPATAEDPTQLLSDYEDAVIEYRDHAQIRVSTPDDEVAHFRDAHTLFARVRHLRLAVLDRMTASV